VLTSQNRRTRRRVRPLSASNSLKASAVATAVVAALVVVPDALDGANGATGTALVVLAFIFAAASRWPASMMQRPVLLAAALIATTAAAVVFVSTATLTGVPGAVLLVEAVLAAWLWWILITDRV